MQIFVGKSHPLRHTYMNQQINPNTYQVFLCTCPAIMPYSLARHTWLVINDHGDIERWEVLYFNNNQNQAWGHIHKNFYSPFEGIRVFPFTENLHWPVSIRSKVDGRQAQNLIKTIRSTPDSYPHADRYELFGPNSNSYIQWVINQHPELSLDLPWNAVGKTFVQ
jgi:hypothetical protein